MRTNEQGQSAEDATRSLARKRLAPRPTTGAAAESTTQGRASGGYGLPRTPKKTFGAPNVPSVKTNPGAAVLPGGRAERSIDQQVRGIAKSAPLGMPPGERLKWTLSEIDRQEKAGKRRLTHRA